MFCFQGDIRQKRIYNSEFPFSHLSQLSSDHTYIIISSEINSNLYTTICQSYHYELEIKILSIEQRRSFIEVFFHRFNKVSMRKRKKNLFIFFSNVFVKFYTR